MSNRITTPKCFRGLLVILSFVFIPTTKALRANSWQKRIDRAFLQVDGVTPEGRFRSFQRALKDPELRTDVSKAIDAVREKGFGKGHPEFIELLWPKGTQARQDLEAISALTKQLPERINEFKDDDSSGSLGGGVSEVIQSTLKSLRFGDENTNFVYGSSVVATSLLERVQSDPDRILRQAQNSLRNAPVEVEYPSYNLLKKNFEDVVELSDSDNESFESENDDGEGDEKKKKSFLTVEPLELRRYHPFPTVSIQLQNEAYTLKAMGPALTEIFSYLELGNNAESTVMPITTPFFISDTAINGTNNMFVKLPQDYEDTPPKPTESSMVGFDTFPETVMATLAFSGVCTSEEVKRQKANLMKRIESAGDIGWKIKTQSNCVDKNDDLQNDAAEPEIFVLQYNAPGTLPWRRMNEVAVVLEKTILENEETGLDAEVGEDPKESESTDFEEEENGNDTDDGTNADISTTDLDLA